MWPPCKKAPILPRQLAAAIAAESTTITANSRKAPPLPSALLISSKVECSTLATRRAPAHPTIETATRDRFRVRYARGRFTTSWSLHDFRPSVRDCASRRTCRLGFCGLTRSVRARSSAAVGAGWFARMWKGQLACRRTVLSVALPLPVDWWPFGPAAARAEFWGNVR